MKLRATVILLAVALLSCSHGTAEGVAPTTDRVVEGIVTETDGSLLSVDYPNQPIGTILADVARAARINLVIETPIQGRTSIKLRNVTWRQIYREALSPVGYTFVESDSLVRVIDLSQTTQTWTPDLLFPTPDRGDELKIAVHFENAPASEVLREIAHRSGVPLVIPFTLDHRATVHLESTTWRPAFRAVLNSHGYTFSEDDLSDGVVTIRPRPDLPEIEPRQTPDVSIQTLWGDTKLLGAILAVAVLTLIHLCFAIGLARRKLGRPTRFLPKWLWGGLVLGGGILPLLVYWLMHESRLSTYPDSTEIQT